VDDATLKDIRAMAASDAKRAGYEEKQIQVGLAHTDVGMTEHYIRQRETPVSEVVLTLPARPKVA
jgi:integrase